MVRVASFDVGIRNLAMCILDVDSESVRIVEWRVLNLCESDTSGGSAPVVRDTCTTGATCKRVARFARASPETRFCGACAKRAVAAGDAVMLERAHTLAALRKLSLADVRAAYAALGSAPDTASRPTRDVMQNAIAAHFAAHALAPVAAAAPRARVADTDLITVGRRMKHALRAILALETVNLVLVENQIGPLAARMKVVQGLITQYFVMQSDDIDIAHVSSANKLRIFAVREGTEPDGYARHKADAVWHAARVLEATESLAPWRTTLTCRKADDFADCFLQAVWSLRTSGALSLTGHTIAPVGLPTEAVRIT